MLCSCHFPLITLHVSLCILCSSKVTHSVWVQPSSKRSHTFRFHTQLVDFPLTSIKVKLTFAVPSCINDRAVLTLYHLKRTAHEQDQIQEDQIRGCEVICGPIRVKPFIDITGQSLQLSLSHPSLLSTPVPPLLVVLDDLFVDNYSQLTEDAAKSYESKQDSTNSSLRRKHLLRSRQLRHLPQTKTQSVQQTTMQISVFSQSKAFCSTPVSRKLLRAMCKYDTLLVTQLVLLVCDCKIIEEEYVNLSGPVREMATHGTEKIKMEDRVKALELLCWISSSAFCDANRYCSFLY